MVYETAIFAAAFVAVVAFVAHRINAASARRELQEYRTKVSNDFRMLTAVLYDQYGKTVTEVIPASFDEDGNALTPEATEIRLVLENKKVAAALTDFQASLYS